jgi:regulatory protein
MLIVLEEAIETQVPLPQTCCVKIRSFQAGKRKGDPITVIFEDNTTLTVDPEIIVRFQLKSQMFVDEALLAQLRQADETLAARRRLIRYLSTRKKTTAEARQYLARAGFSDPAIENAMGIARELGLLDDTAFANAFVRTQKKVAKKGPRAIAHEMRARGVTDELADAALAANYPTEQQRELARAAAQKRLASLKPNKRDATTTPKLYQFLLRRGFEPEICSEVVRELLGDPFDQENN